jgi:hypothetical protein
MMIFSSVSLINLGATSKDPWSREYWEDFGILSLVRGMRHNNLIKLSGVSAWLNPMRSGVLYDIRQISVLSLPGVA